MTDLRPIHPERAIVVRIRRLSKTPRVASKKCEAKKGLQIRLPEESLHRSDVVVLAGKILFAKKTS